MTFACRMLDLQILRNGRFDSIARVLKTIKLNLSKDCYKRTIFSLIIQFASIIQIINVNNKYIFHKNRETLKN